ncbi:hypothetical protein HPB51_015247 [Rhipicephalus microplus]|uniref:Tick transposon n=1 Tax=Rhipicephalus microplus TaxID=6941 RepID=A0A9J6DNX1_RHIMP|nr:hypothetical protein HPB51_015247 [Rhipicephalus microplus]
MRRVRGQRRITHRHYLGPRKVSHRVSWPPPWWKQPSLLHLPSQRLRGAVHAPLDFASGTIPGATLVPSPEDRRNSSPVAASELCTALQAVATTSQRLADATVAFSAACARAMLPPPSMEKIPDFTGVDQDPTVWLDEIHSLAHRHAWTDDVTLSLAVSRLRESAKAWHQYYGCKYKSWSYWTTAFVTAFPPLPSAYDDHFMRMRLRRQAPSEDARPQYGRM